MHLWLRLPGRALGPVPGTDAVAVLASGGLDSAILVGQLASEGREVTPIYVRFGLAWEDVELRRLRGFLASLAPSRTNPLIVLEQPVTDIYGEHWSLTGQGVPDRDSPDEAVYLPGRNLLLLAKPSVWCVLNGIPTIALGTLAANPFPDADREFFAGFSALVSRALGCGLRVITPFAGRAKREVLDAGRQFALDLTFSCIAPRSELHCGRCNKCAERQLAFSELGISDTTEYATS
jgi:7-cyano-7-deazaguanine synthase